MCLLCDGYITGTPTQPTTTTLIPTNSPLSIPMCLQMTNFDQTGGVSADLNGDYTYAGDNGNPYYTNDDSGTTYYIQHNPSLNSGSGGVWTIHDDAFNSFSPDGICFDASLDNCLGTGNWATKPVSGTTYSYDGNSNLVYCPPSPHPTQSPNALRYSDPTKAPSFINCETTQEIKHINWDSLQNAVDNSNDIPSSLFTISLDTNKLELTFDIDLEYVGFSSDGNYDNNYNLGTTYVVGFNSFGTGNKINEPGNCENRIVNSFQNGNFNQWWTYSEYPYLLNELGDNAYLSYPPPSNHWTLSIGENVCTPINYLGVFSWNDLTQCKDYNGNDLINIVDNDISITLYGSLYVNLVSPYSMNAVDTGIYRSFPLIQQDFEIYILKQINVLSSTGVELFITSIIGIYEDESDGSFELSILAQSADYIKLINPTVLATPFGITTGVSITTTTTTCLSASTYTCGQIFTLSISSGQINCPPADMSGVYDIAFDVECRFNEYVCNTFINDNPSGTSVALSVESNFIDTYCEPEIYSVIFEGNMTFYDDVEFLIDHSISGNNYVIGQDTIYVEIVVDFPEDGSVHNYYNVFQVDIENVFVCTADDTIDMTQDLDQQNGNGGCLSSNIDADGAYDIIINGVEMNYDSNIILTATESNVVRFSFKTFDIGRTKMYVHAQLLLTLINGVRRRLSYKLLSESQNSNQIRHFVGPTTVISNDHESINMFSTKINNKENNSDKASNKWMKSVMISSVLSLIGVYFMM